MFGVLYIGWLASYFIALRNLPDVGAAYTIASIVAIAITDIFAMLVGTTLGRTPLTSISPNKAPWAACSQRRRSARPSV